MHEMPILFTDFTDMYLNYTNLFKDECEDFSNLVLRR
jgi:hypothetical protein